MKLGKIVLAVGLVLLVAGSVWSDSGMMSVQVKQGQLRSTPSFLGSIVGAAPYGDRVQTLRKQGDWVDVRSSKSVTGWIHESALTSKTVVLNSGGAVSSSANSQEVALAGKGFNEDVEKRYRAENGRISYAWVDHMEYYKISTARMITFLSAGDVRASQGGAR